MFSFPGLFSKVAFFRFKTYYRIKDDEQQKFKGHCQE